MKKNTNSLEADAQDLLTWLSKSHDLPSYKTKKIVINNHEILTIAGLTYQVIDEKEICDFDAFESIYQELKKMGYSWINLNCAGILNDALIFTIELPRYPANTPSGYTSINFSGPNQCNDKIKPEWDLTKHYKFRRNT